MGEGRVETIRGERERAREFTMHLLEEEEEVGEGVVKLRTWATLVLQDDV